ncbi:hypothetical protein CTA2_8602 [Colletotrichum tanaceti]|uniref:Uncharacterized protein n=1 Tax=Colletotrichum tanaceti TaxID=1306861 RepID=A0A4U6X6Y4_9PEZI|nr:hypothetical protein CTA2_8602 [Colletotrichum tanaceti]TKW49197.1 hypothetical protein CTA1_3227 [Colletotrichum tanaceti]
MRNPFKPRKAPAQTWSAKRSSVLSADDPVFAGLDETERKSLEATPPIHQHSQRQQQQQQQQTSLRDISPGEPLKLAGGDGGAAALSGVGPSSHDSIGTDSGHGFAAVSGSFAADGSHSGC